MIDRKNYASAGMAGRDRKHRTYFFDEAEFPGRHIVVWSGGYDSTLVLAEVARRYSATNTVIAVVVESAHLHDGQVKMEQRAREAFLKHAAACGWNIHVVTVRLDTTAVSCDWTVHALHAQALLWFHAVVPFLSSNDKVYWGYIRRDEYWLVRDRLVAAMEACTHAAFISGVSFEYPLAGADKRDVVARLKSIGVPTANLWTCDDPVAGGDLFAPCGCCGKCVALREADAEADAEAARALDLSKLLVAQAALPLTLEKVAPVKTANRKPTSRARRK